MAEASRPANPAQNRPKTLLLENSVELRPAPEEVFDYLSEMAVARGSRHADSEPGDSRAGG